MESGRCLRTQLHAGDRSRIFRAFAASRVQASFSSVQRKCRDHRTHGLSPARNGAPAKSLRIATFETKDLRARRFRLTRRSRPSAHTAPKKTFWSDSTCVL